MATPAVALFKKAGKDGQGVTFGDVQGVKSVRPTCDIAECWADNGRKLSPNPRLWGLCVRAIEGHAAAADVADFLVEMIVFHLDRVSDVGEPDFAPFCVAGDVHIALARDLRAFEVADGFGILHFCLDGIASGPAGALIHIRGRTHCL